ncbi:amidohydrolase family protein [Nocardia sp. bgisy134]|uniref:amidohydrolase family protein n=1 Tax=Nocardia sp. bgisy134 TaxID=3413789 RepID=UPI003D71D789
MGILIEDAHVLTMDGISGSTPVVRSIRIEGDRIAEIGAGLTPADGDTVIDGCDRLVVPGLVNAHTHSWETLFKGRYDNLPLELWLTMSYPILGDSRVAPELVRLRSTLFAIESLKAGVTTIVDDVIENPNQEWAQLAAVFDAYDEVGIRANISGHVITRPFVDTIPFLDDLLDSAMVRHLRSLPALADDEYLDFCRRAFDTLHGRGDGRLRFMTAPSAPQRCSPELIAGATQLARTNDAECHIHVLETKTQMITGPEHYGGTLVEYLHRIGALTANTTLAHGIWVTESDIELVADARTSLAHNPVSNLKLGSGIAAWRLLHDAGVNVALGTDGCSSSDSPRMLDVVKTAALLHKVTDPDFRRWPRVDEVLTAATIGGARSAVLDRVIGTIEVGKQADLVLFDLDTMAFTPRQKLDNQLVYSENGSSIDTVLVAGRVVVAGGEVTTVDERATRAELDRLLPEIIAWQDDLDRRNAVLADAISAAYFRAVATPGPVNRFAGDERAWLA